MLRSPALSICILLVLAPGAACQEQKLFDDLRTRGALDGRPDQQALEHLVERLKPEVERLAGRRFKSPLTVRVSTVQDAARSLNQDFLLQYERLYSEYPKRRREWLASLGAQALAAGLLGKYGMIDRTLHLLPQRIDAILKLFDFDPELGRGLFTLIVAHEMVHALQDQHVGLAARARKLNDSIDVATFVAAIEGQAEYVSYRLAKELGLDAEGAAFTKMVGLGAQRQLAPRNPSEITGREHRLLNQFGYVIARDHLIELGEEKALERSWRYLLEPLPSTATYYGATELRPDDEHLARCTNDVAELLGRGRWSVARTRFGPLALHSEFSEASTEELREQLAGLRGGHEVIATLPPPLMRVRVGLLSFEDAAAADAFVASARTWWKREKRIFLGDRRASPATGRFRTRDLETQKKLQLPTGTTGFYQYAELGGGMAAVRCHVLWLARGRFVLHLFEQNHELDDDTRNTLIRTLFERVAATAKR